MTQDSQPTEQTPAPQELSFLDRAEEALENLGEDVKGVFEELVARAKELFGVSQSTAQETLQKDVIDPASSLAQDATQVAEHAMSEASKTAEELNKGLAAAADTAQQEAKEAITSVEAALGQEGVGTAAPDAAEPAPVPATSVTTAVAAEPASVPAAESASVPAAAPVAASAAAEPAAVTTTPAA